MKISTTSILFVLLLFSLLQVDVMSQTKNKKQKTSTKAMMDKQSRISLDDTGKMMAKQIRHKKSSYDVREDYSSAEEDEEEYGSTEGGDKRSSYDVHDDATDGEEEDEEAVGSPDEGVVIPTCDNNTKLSRIPTDPDDFDEPAWMEIIELAFPPWKIDQDECGRLTSVDSGEVHAEYPMAARVNDDSGGGGGKWNPCYYTKRFDGLDPKYGGYPTPIDTRYPYAFAAPFYGQPGDGSEHHCNIDVSPGTKTCLFNVCIVQNVFDFGN
jgi:hypothetical protein